MEERKAAAFPPPPCPRRRAARAGAQFGFYYHGAALGRPKLAQPGRAPGCRCRPMRLTLTACQATDTGLSKVQLLRLGPHQNGDGGRPCHARRLAMALGTASKRHAGVCLLSLSPSPHPSFPHAPCAASRPLEPWRRSARGGDARCRAAHVQITPRKIGEEAIDIPGSGRGGAGPARARKRRSCAGACAHGRARGGAGQGTPVLRHSYRAAPTHRHV